MRTVRGSMFVLAIWFLLAVAMPLRVQAACPRSAWARIAQNGDFTYRYPYRYVLTPDYYFHSPQGSFWALGWGDPLPGAGHDNGAFPAHRPGTWDGWLVGAGNTGILAYLFGEWVDPRVDGCVMLPPVPQPAKVVVALSDGTPWTGLFNVSCAAWRPWWSFDFAISLRDDIRLVPIPRIVESRCSRDGGTVSYTLSHRPLVGGVQPGDCGTETPLVTGYRVYWRAVPRGATPPAGRERGLWDLLAGPFPLDTNGTGSLPYMADDDVYFATSLVFDSGFETAHVSESTFTSQCAPILADPPSNNIWRLKRSAEPAREE